MVGRDGEVDQIVNLLREPGVRLVTLSGPGGVGKTRLAMRVVAAFEPGAAPGQRAGPTPFPAGVGFAPLASIADSRLVASSIARSLLISHDDLPAFDAIVETLGSRRMLLILDNFEQLLASAPLVTDLLTSCPGLKVLVTSRSLLRISGEYDIRVAPLGLPPTSRTTMADLARSDAAALFIERSRAALAGESFTDDDAPAIAEICSRLDGLPLAIELAAARVAILAPRMLADRLDRRLPLLIGGARDLPARQQTLRGAIAWSDDLLSASERWLFHRLAVFAGGFTLDAAAALLAGSPHAGNDAEPSCASRALETVTALMGHSLLRRLDPAGGEPRFAMLGTVREYAAECLLTDDELETAWREHARFMLAFALQAMDEFSGPDQRVWIERVEADHDNVRAALAWALDHEPELALRLSASLWRFWEIRGHLLEGHSWISRALDTSGETPIHVRATALNNLGNLTYRLAGYGEARTLYEQSLAINRELEKLTDVADSLNNLGLLASAQADYEAARRFLDESVRLRRQDERSDRLSLGLHNLAEIEIEAGSPEEAVPLLEEALVLRMRRRDDRGAAYVRYNLGRAGLALGDAAGGEANLRKALATFREVGEKIGIADTLVELGVLAMHRGELGDARALLKEGLQLRIDLGDKRGVLSALEVVAYLAASVGDVAAAATLLSATMRQRNTLHIPQAGHQRDERKRTETAVKRSLGPTVFAEYEIQGEQYTLSRAIDAGFGRLARQVETGAPIDSQGAAGPKITPREQDVLRLLVQGLADRDIAAELSISPRTASTHVTNILRKFGKRLAPRLLPMPCATILTRARAGRRDVGST